MFCDLRHWRLTSAKVGLAGAAQVGILPKCSDHWGSGKCGRGKLSISSRKECVSPENGRM